MWVLPVTTWDHNNGDVTAGLHIPSWPPGQISQKWGSTNYNKTETNKIYHEKEKALQTKFIMKNQHKVFCNKTRQCKPN